MGSISFKSLSGLMDQAILARMKRVSVTDLKNKLSHYLRLVKRGETLEVIERSSPTPGSEGAPGKPRPPGKGGGPPGGDRPPVPIARIEGVSGKAPSKDDLLERLIRDGIVNRGKRIDPKIILDFKPVPCKEDPVKVLIEMRGDR